MDKWIKKLSGAVIASALALTLSSRAYADPLDVPVPDLPVPQYEEKAPETGTADSTVQSADPSGNNGTSIVNSDSKETATSEGRNTADEPKNSSSGSEKQDTEGNSSALGSEKSGSPKPDAASETKPAVTEPGEPDGETKAAESAADIPAEDKNEQPSAEEKTADTEESAPDPGKENPGINDDTVNATNTVADNDGITDADDPDTAGTDPASNDKTSEFADSDNADTDSGDDLPGVSATETVTTVKTGAKMISSAEKLTFTSNAAEAKGPETLPEEADVKSDEQTRSSGGSDNGETGTVTLGSTVFTPGASANIDLSSSTADEHDFFGFDSGNTSAAADDCFYMVNYNGSSQSLTSTNSDINIKAAGLNRLGSIQADGNVNLTGTGILLVDNIELSEGCKFFLHPISGIYDSGSVAVFLRQNTSTNTENAQETGTPKTVYKLINKDVPGILDDSYEIPEGIELVLPGSSSLILQSLVKETYTTYNDNGQQTSETVTTYAAQPDYSAAITAENTADQNNKYSYVYSAPHLNIPASSGLTLQSGATISMNTLGGMYGGQSIIPTLTINGSLDNSGSIAGNTTGIVDLDETSHISGTGTYKDCRVYFKSQNHVGSQKLTMNLESTSSISTWLYLGCDVNIDSTSSADESVVSFGNLNISGVCNLVFSGGCSIDSINLADNAALNIYAHDMYEQDCPFTLKNSITGTGSILLASGNYIVNNSNFELEDSVSLSTIGYTPNGDPIYYAVTVSDTSGKLFSKLLSTDLSIKANPVSIELSHSAVPVFTVDIDCVKDFHSDYYEWEQKEASLDIPCSILDLLDPDLALVSSDSSVSFSAIANLFSNHFTGESAYIEVYTISGNKLLKHIIKKTASGFTTGTVNADEIWLIRRVNESGRSVAPGTAILSTNTSATGTGIIGNSGAGSMTAGTGQSILSSDETTNTSGDGNDNHDSGNGNDNENGGNNNSGEDDSSSDESLHSPTVINNQNTPDRDLVITVTEKITGTYAGVSLEEAETVYTLSVEADGKPLSRLNRSITVRFSCPAPESGGEIFVVFRDKDGALKVFKAKYDRIKGQLVFETDMLGDFAVVCIDFNGELYSDEFFAYLETFASVKKLN